MALAPMVWTRSRTSNSALPRSLLSGRRVFAVEPARSDVQSGGSVAEWARKFRWRCRLLRIPTMSILQYFATLAIFFLPGILAVKVLAPEVRQPLFQFSAGFVISLALFALPAWPLLWFGLEVSIFWAVLVAWWSILTIGLMAGFRHSRSGAGAIEAETVEPSGPSSDRSGVQERVLKLSPIVLMTYFLWSGILADYMSILLDPSWARQGSPLVILAVSLLVGLVFIPTCLRRALAGPDHPTGSTPPRAWTALAYTTLVALMVGVTFQSQPQSDDAYYLTASHQFAIGGPLNREDPTLPGDGFPVAPHMRLLAWELLGATLGRAGGVHPMVQYYTLMPPLLVLMVVGVHWAIFEEWLVGRRLAPLAILALIACWLVCNSGSFSPGTSLLTRPWQGKSMLWQLGIPLICLAIFRLFQAPSLRSYVFCLLCQAGALAMSSSAVFLLPVLTSSLIVAFSCWGIGDGRRVTLRSGLACLTCCAPSLVYGAVIRTAFHAHPVLTRVDQGIQLVP